MIDELDEIIRELLIKEIPIKNGEVDIAFDQPSREWSSRVNRPTLNLFLYDVSENTKLRSRERMVSRQNGSAREERAPSYVDLQYMITVWAAEADDEHRLIARMLMALFRNPVIPDDLLPESFYNQPVPIPLEVAQPEPIVNTTDIWSVLDNEMKPGVNMKATIALSPYEPITGPLVRTRELRIAQAEKPPLPPYALVPGHEANYQLRKVEEAGEAQYWTIGGTVTTKKELTDLRLTVVEKGQDIPLLPEGRFTVSGLQPGEYTLSVEVKGRKTPKVQKITVPSPDYDIKV